MRADQKEELENLRKQHELLKKMLEQQEQLRALQGRQEALMAMQDSAEQALAVIEDTGEMNTNTVRVIVIFPKQKNSIHYFSFRHSH